MKHLNERSQFYAISKNKKMQHILTHIIHAEKLWDTFRCISYSLHPILQHNLSHLLMGYTTISTITDPDPIHSHLLQLISDIFSSDHTYAFIQPFSLNFTGHYRETPFTSNMLAQKLPVETINPNSLAHQWISVIFKKTMQQQQNHHHNHPRWLCLTNA